MTNFELAVALAKAETEEDVIRILQSCGYWDDNSLWYPLGDNSNNYSIIGNQQSSPESAFVEKMINSIDACLNGECLKRGLNPMSPDAPQSMEEALEKFYGIRRGGLMMVEPNRRSELAQNIIVAATGKKRGGPINLCIADRGEGQTPKRMPETLLSISKSNKLKIPFVQGQFNMGGTGALPFCGRQHLQLMISRRCPDIPNSDIDETYDQWSVTIVRREAPRDGRKSSMYTYLTNPKGRILSFEADSLAIVPVEHKAETKGFGYESMSYGTFIKLYNYQLSVSKTAITLDLYNKLSLLIPNLGLPIRFRECRDFNANTNAANLSGLVSRLYDDRSAVMEDGFPTSGSFAADGQRVKLSIYLFKPGTEGKYRGKHEGVLFCINGQTQGVQLDSFFNSVNLSYIQNSILVVADCSELDISHQEELFMTSRDRIRSSRFSKELVKCIEQELREHEGLKAAAFARRTAALKDKIADKKPLKEVLQKIVKTSDVLYKLFVMGQDISAPFSRLGLAGTKEHFVGKLHPTFFRLKGKFKDGKLTKQVPCSASFRVQYATDAVNDFFSRPAEEGELILKMNGTVRKDLIRRLKLYNGVADLTVSLPENAAPGDRYTFETEIRDDYIVDTFPCTFFVEVREAEETSSGPAGSPRQPVDPLKKGNQQHPGSFAVPEIIPVTREDWEAYQMDRFTALVYRPTDEGGDYYVNMDNDYLLTELKGLRDRDRIELTKARYTNSIALIGMSVVSYYKNQKKNDLSVDVQSEVKRFSSMVAPVLIPMLESMANLDLEETSVA